MDEDCGFDLYDGDDLEALGQKESWEHSQAEGAEDEEDDEDEEEALDPEEVRDDYYDESYPEPFDPYQ